MRLPFLEDLIRKTPPDQLVSALQLTPFDELMVIHLDTGRYESRFHREGKFYSPVLDGTFASLMKYSADHLVYPDDRNLHAAFLDLSTIQARMAAASPPGLLNAEIRYLSMDGNWLSMAHLLLYGASYGLPENQVYFYLYDIRELDRRINGSTDNRVVTEHMLNLMPDILTEEQFFAIAQERLPSLEGTWCMIAVDIKHFKLFKELNGQENGDALLIRFAEILQSLAQRKDGIAGYRGQDDFGLLIPFDKGAMDRLFAELCKAIESLSSSRGFFPVLGICLIDETGHNALELFNRAALTAEEIKDDLQAHIRIYEPEAHQRHLEEFRILADFNTALKSGEIQFFVQPQVNVTNGSVVGMESLARWRRSDGSYVPPTVFVPVLEKYGIIGNLDFFIWESVCKWIRHLIDSGIRPVPVSVNVSRIDLFVIDVPATLRSLVEKYQLPEKILEVEITESAYVDDSDRVRAAVAELRKEGFPVLMDDFGSGYSSLNMLRSMNMDINKLDAQFLHFSMGDELKGISILESVINMTKTLGTPLIVEGVESPELVQYLSDMNIRYMQGFYFYRPMPPERFETILADPGKADYDGISFHGNDSLRIREFLDGNIYSDAMLNNILGPVAFYCFRDNNVDIVRYNQPFLHMIGLPVKQLESRRSGILESFYPEDREPFVMMLENAKNDRINGARGHFRIYKPNMSLFWMQIHVYFLRSAEEGGDLFYASCQDITELQYVNYDLPGGYYRSSLDNGFELQYISHGMEDLLGFTAEEIREEFDNKLINMIHPEDAPRVIEESNRIRAGGSASISPYRIRHKDGSWRYVMDQCRLTDRFGVICWQSVLLDITEVMILRNSMSLLKTYSTDCIIFVKREGDRLATQIAVYGLGDYLHLSEEEFARELKDGDLGSKWIQTDEKLADQILAHYDDPSVLNGVYTIKRTDGHEYPLHMRFNRIHDQDSPAECIISLFTVAHRGIE